jgi:phosphatidylglycerophosphate synthase
MMLYKSTRIILRNLKLFPNQITLIRLLTTAVIWGMVIAKLYNYVGIGLIICFISDVLDGHLARRLHMCTKFGAKFDSLADNILIPSALIWLLMIKSELFIEQPLFLSLAILTYVFSLLVSYLYTRQINVSQLFLSKLSGLTQYIFGIHTFLTHHYNVELFYVTMGSFFISSLESLALQFLKVKVNEHLTSIIFRWPFLKRAKVYLPKSGFINRMVVMLYGAEPRASKNVEMIS